MEREKFDVIMFKNNEEVHCTSLQPEKYDIARFDRNLSVIAFEWQKTTCSWIVASNVVLLLSTKTKV